jgi:hypothetical protein
MDHSMAHIELLCPIIRTSSKGFLLCYMFLSILKLLAFLFDVMLCAVLSIYFSRDVVE